MVLGSMFMSARDHCFSESYGPGHPKKGESYGPGHPQKGNYAQVRRKSVFDHCWQVVGIWLTAVLQAQLAFKKIISISLWPPVWLSVDECRAWGLAGAQEIQQEPAFTCTLEVMHALPPLTPLGKVMVKSETQKWLLGLLFSGGHPGSAEGPGALPAVTGS